MHCIIKQADTSVTDRLTTIVTDLSLLVQNEWWREAILTCLKEIVSQVALPPSEELAARVILLTAALKSTNQSWASDVCFHRNFLTSHCRLQISLPPIYPLPLSLSTPTFFSPCSLISLRWARSLPYSFCSGPQAETDLFNKRLAGWVVDVAAVEQRLMWPFVPQESESQGGSLQMGSDCTSSPRISLNECRME